MPSHLDSPSDSSILAAPLLTDALAIHARERGTRPAFTFLRDGEEPDGTLDWAEVHRQSQRIATLLAERGLAGERAVLVVPQGREFMFAFFGCLLAGVVAVPLMPPTTRRQLERVRLVGADCGARAVLSLPGTAALAGDLVSGGDGVAQVDISADSGRSALPGPAPEAPAFLQYTSGSTGSPRGVVVTHGNLAVQCGILHRAWRMRSDDVCVSWLPVFHDMGLIGSVAQAVAIGHHGVHMTPQSFVRRPARWLHAVSRWRATLTGGPDFAWRMLIDRLTPADLAALDLSALRVAFSGSETVRASTLERVDRLLAPAGLAPSALLPCYGLAEATLMVSGGPLGRPWQAAESPDGPAGIRHVACGRPIPAGSVAIIDPASGQPVAEGEVGEVWVSGQHVAAGYWGRTEETAATFAARLPEDARTWLRTGDLAFLRRGQLHFTGRIKDLLVVNGVKHHPEDVETTIQDEVPSCRGGACAVFQVGDDSAAGLVAVVEQASRAHLPAERAALLRAVAAAVWSRHALSIAVVIPVRPGVIPRTTSGKVRRGETRRHYLAGAYDHPTPTPAN